MGDPSYEIIPYRHEHRDEVLDVMGYLWGVRGEMAESYFQWKYLENPARVDPPGMVAIHGGKVVGFRGYFPNRWTLLGRKLVILSPCDTCVDPAHRRRGLSVRMGYEAMVQYAGNHRFFLNLSSSESSLPGYKKMGFFPLVPRTSAVKYTTREYIRLGFRKVGLHGLGEYLSRCRHLELSGQSHPSGSYRVQTTGETLPVEMAEIIAASPGGGRLQLDRDSDLYTWRFRNPRRTYAFHYLIEGSQPVAFVAMRLAPKNQGDILDYGGSAKELEILIRSVLGSGFYRSLSTWDFALRDGIGPCLGSLGFVKAAFPDFLRSSSKMEDLPLLLRPVRAESEEQDWFIGEVDLRRKENWQISGICSEAY
jgi:GNAT superfamily N-acetyltransferase